MGGLLHLVQRGGDWAGRKLWHSRIVDCDDDLNTLYESVKPRPHCRVQTGDTSTCFRNRQHNVATPPTPASATVGGLRDHRVIMR